MKILCNKKIVLLAAVLMLGISLAPFAHAIELHHHSMDMSDCSVPAHCVACGNSIISSPRIHHSLFPSLDTVSSFLIPEVVGPAVSHYHPPG